MTSTPNKLKLDLMREVQGVNLPEEESREVLGIAEALAATMNRAAAALPFDSEPADFARALEETAGSAESAQDGEGAEK